MLVVRDGTRGLVVRRFSFTGEPSVREKTPTFPTEFTIKRKILDERKFYKNTIDCPGGTRFIVFLSCSSLIYNPINARITVKQSSFSVGRFNFAGRRSESFQISRVPSLLVINLVTTLGVPPPREASDARRHVRSRDALLRLSAEGRPERRRASKFRHTKVIKVSVFVHKLRSLRIAEMNRCVGRSCATSSKGSTLQPPVSDVDPIASPFTSYSLRSGRRVWSSEKIYRSR